MSVQLFHEMLMSEIKKERESQKDDLAYGYGKEDYDYRVGRLRGYTDVEVFCANIMRRINNGEE